MRHTDFKQQQLVAPKQPKVDEFSNIPVSTVEQPRNKSTNNLNNSTDSSFYNSIFPRPKRELPGKGQTYLNNRQSHEKHKSLHQQGLNTSCQQDSKMVLNQTSQLMGQVQAQMVQRRSTASSYEPSQQGKSMQLLKPSQQDYQSIQNNKSGQKQILEQQRNNEYSDNVEQYLCASPSAQKLIQPKEQLKQQQQRQPQQQQQQQGKNALNLKNLVSQGISSSSGQQQQQQQQYLRKSGISKQRQNQYPQQAQSTTTTPQSQSMVDCSNSNGTNLSFPYNYQDLKNKNNTNISIIQQDSQGINTTIIEPTLNTLALPTEPQLTNTSSLISPELGQLNQLDFLQIEKTITRNILSNIQQQQQQQQQKQQYFEYHSIPSQPFQQQFLGSPTNSTNNSSLVFDKNSQATGISSSLPNSPLSYHHKIGQPTSNITNSCSDDKFLEIQNQLKSIKKELKYQNRIQEKSSQQEEDQDNDEFIDHALMNRQKKIKSSGISCCNNNNNTNNTNNSSKSISKLSAQQRALLLEQAIQRKKKQSINDISTEKQDYSIDKSESSQASLESQLKELQQSVRISQQENEKISIEAQKYKLEIARLEGIIAQKECFQQEREKQNEIIYSQQKIMILNYEAIKQQSEDFKSNWQSLKIQLADKEKENQMLKQQLSENDKRLENYLNNHGNNEDKSQLLLMKQLKDEIQKLKDDINLKDKEILTKNAEITTKDELLLQANTTTERLQNEILKLEQSKSDEGVEQQKMKQQIQISEATILLLNQEIESYKNELIQVQQLCSIAEAPSKYTLAGNTTIGVSTKQKVTSTGGKIGEEQIVQQLSSIRDEHQKLQVNYQKLKAREVEYEKSINDLKRVFQEENNVRKTLETELTQLKTDFSVQKIISTNGGSASKVVEDLILKQKKENTLNAINEKSSSLDQEINIYKDIIQDLRGQIEQLQNEIAQGKQDQEKNQLTQGKNHNQIVNSQQGNNDPMQVLDSVVAEFRANNNNMSDSIVELSNNNNEQYSNGHQSIYQACSILNKGNLETVIESGESVLRPDTTPSEENSLQQSLKCSFIRSTSPRDEKTVTDLQGQVDEVNIKLKQVQRESADRLKRLENSEKERKQYEEQLKQQKNVIEQLEKEVNISGSQQKQCNNCKRHQDISNSYGQQLDSSSKYSVTSSNQEGDSVMDTSKLLCELQDKMNQNGQLELEKEKLQEKLNEAEVKIVGLEKEIEDLKEKINDQEMEIEVLNNQMAAKKEDNNNNNTNNLEQQSQFLGQIKHSIFQNEVIGNSNYMSDNRNDPRQKIMDLSIQESIEKNLDLQISDSNVSNMQVRFGKESKISDEMKSSPDNLQEDSNISQFQDTKELNVLQELNHMVKNFQK